MRRFVLYRASPPAEYREGGYANEPEVPQLEGVEFSDGTVCIRWLTDLRSHSVWPDFATFEKVHGHPEYQSRVFWLDGASARLDPGGPLTADERRALDLTGELAGALRRVVGDGPTAAADWGELARTIHDLQHAVMAQAAARAYPGEYRLLGGPPP